MRLLLHDYGGYAFIADLSRALAVRGTDVVHAFSSAVQTPQGALHTQPGDPSGLRFAPIRQSQIDKRSFVRRWKQEKYHLAELRKLVEAERPDVVLSANAPSVVQAGLVQFCRDRGVPTVTWVQDLYGVAAHTILRRKLPIVGDLIGRHFRALDSRALRDSDAVILITNAFDDLVDACRANRAKTYVIPNWGPLKQVLVLDKHNAWAQRHGLGDKRCLLYSGTLAMKHNPDLLLTLAKHFRGDDAVRVVVISEGDGVGWLRGQADGLGLTNLITLPFQPYDELPQVLATGDVLLAVLEPAASRFSVPSKVATYLCAGRPLLLAVPPDNQASRIVEEIDAGIVVSPREPEKFASAADALLRDDARRAVMGQNGRRYAESNFDIDEICEQFQAILAGVTRGTHATPCAEAHGVSIASN